MKFSIHRTPTSNVPFLCLLSVWWEFLVALSAHPETWWSGAVGVCIPHDFSLHCSAEEEQATWRVPRLNLTKNTSLMSNVAREKKMLPSFCCFSPCLAHLKDGEMQEKMNDSAANSAGVHCPRLLTSVTEKTAMSAFCVFCEWKSKIKSLILNLVMSFDIFCFLIDSYVKQMFLFQMTVCCNCCNMNLGGTCRHQNMSKSSPGLKYWSPQLCIFLCLTYFSFTPKAKLFFKV